MIYLLIDNCIILGQLIGKHVYSPKLLALKTWVELGQAQLLVPNVLYQEWSNHKEEEIAKLKNASNARDKNIDDYKEYGVYEIVGKKKEQKFQQLVAQINDVQDLLDKAIQFDASNEVKIQAVNHRQERLAPFHNNTDSLYDALLIFSTIEFVKKNEIDSFYFITKNYKDFKQTGSEIVLHEDIRNVAEGLEIYYHEKLDDLTTNGSQFGLSEVYNPKSQRDEHYPLKETVLVDKDEPLIDQLDTLFSDYLYKEITFVPLHVLSNHHPIQTNGSADFHEYTLLTGNEEIVELFKDIEWTEDNKVRKIPEQFTEGVENAQEKVEFIRDKLVGNLAHHITNSKGGSADIYYFKSGFCDCLLCSFGRAEYDKVLEKTYEDSQDVKELMQRGYASYKLGDKYQAARTFLKAREIAEQSELPLTKFIASYNLSKIEMMIPFYEASAIDKSLVDDLKAIDIESEFNSYNHVPTHSIVRWIYNENFVHAAQRDILNLKKKIRAQHLNPLSGHNSYSNNTRLLVYQMLKLDLFMQRNFIVFDSFAEYIHLVHWFAESAYASHSIRKRNNGQLEHFDNWLLTLLLEHSYHEDLMRLNRIYKRETVEYKKNTSDNFLNFPDKIVKLLLALDQHSELVEQKIKTSNHFNELNRRMVRNGLILAGQCNFHKKDISNIGNALVTYIERSAIHSDDTAIKYFINHKGKFLKPATIKKIWFASMNNPRFHSFGLHHTIGNLVEKYGIKLKIADWEFDQVLNFYLIPCGNCGNQQHQPEVLFHLFRVSDKKERKTAISQILKAKIEKEFDVDDYVMSTIFKIIEPNEKYLEKAIEASVPRIVTTGAIQTVNRGLPHERYRTLDNFINMCFCLDLDLSQKKFDRLRNINPYYDWLLNMDGFNYRNFEVDWTTEMGTIFYQKRMFKSEALKSHLLEFLNTRESHFKPEIEKAYLNIYVREIWKRNK